MPLRLVIAPDSFKGSLPAAEVAQAIADGWRGERPADELVILPQADGGEGTMDAIATAVSGAVRRSAGRVTGPDGRPTDGMWVQLPDGIALVELAAVSGLPLMDSLDPLGAQTTGLGQLIGAALDAGATSLVIGLGGSASTDAGAGALRALGLELFDHDGRSTPQGGAALAAVARIDRTAMRPPPVGGVTLLTDVDAPLLGARGAAAVFGPQKGATAADVVALDAALAHFAQLLGGDPLLPGAGAAGGTAFGLSSVWGAEIVGGADRVAELSGLEAGLRSAGLLITGEGRFDATSVTGKVVGQAIARAARHEVDVAIVAGQLAIVPSIGGRPIPAWALADTAGGVGAAMRHPVPALVEAGRRAAAHYTAAGA